jgi:ribulose-phosphate 3-epimerase
MSTAMSPRGVGSAEFTSAEGGLRERPPEGSEGSGEFTSAEGGGACRPKEQAPRWRGCLMSSNHNSKMPSSVRVAPSILSADLGRLAEEVREVEAAGADWIHVDVMDGRFVPNMTFGPDIVRAVRRATTLPIDVHLMVVEPERIVDAFADAGADTLTVQLEASVHLQRTLDHVRKLGKRAGVALNPHTPEDALRYVLGDLDLVLVMTVNPGFGAQSFLPATVSKIERVRAMIDASGHAIDLEVDGGIAAATAATVVKAGARVLVAGHAVFGQSDRRAALNALRDSIA